MSVTDDLLENARGYGAAADTGLRPGWAPESLRDTAKDVRQSLARVAANPLIPYKDSVRGFVYSVTDGSLTEVA
jgi:carbonic anhydrase